jgi:sigma-B regulation protein RsbU (phosphoserine phosphatase)
LETAGRSVKTVSVSDGLSASAVSGLLEILPPTETDEPGQFASDLLYRLAELTEAEAGLIEVDRGDGRGLQPLAGFGAVEKLEDAGMRYPLPVCRPWAGELALLAEDRLGIRALTQLTAERFGLHLENERLRETDLRRQTWLNFLAEISELLAQSLDIKLTMALIPRLVIPRLGQWCALYLTGTGDDLTPAAAAHSDEAELASLLAQLAAGGARWRETVRSTGAVAVTHPFEAYVIPLVARGQRLGTLAIGRYPGNLRDPDEMAIADDLARRAALALDNSRAHEERRRVAQALQQALLPPTLPEIPALGLGAEYVPAADGVDVGGDFYDVVSHADGTSLLVVGDVSGKGAQAATVTGLIRDVIRVLAREGRPPAAILSTLNDTLFERHERHCTLALAVVSPVSDTAVPVTVYLAGHDHPLLVSSTGRVHPAGVWGTALGLLPKVNLPEARITLNRGDAMVFVTDGVTDRRRGNDFFGLERLMDAARQLAGHPAEVMAARLRAATIDFSPDPPRDDIAILVLRNES